MGWWSDNQIEAENLADISESFDIEAVPSFLLIRVSLSCLPFPYPGSCWFMSSSFRLRLDSGRPLEWRKQKRNTAPITFHHIAMNTCLGADRRARGLLDV